MRSLAEKPQSSACAVFSFYPEKEGKDYILNGLRDVVVLW